MRYISLFFLFVSALLLASCAPSACTNCHPNAAESAPPIGGGLCDDLLNKGFSGPWGTVFTVGTEGSPSKSLQWNAQNNTLSSFDGSVNISVPEGEQVTPKWPVGYSFMRGSTLASCQNGLYILPVALVHILS